MTDAELLDALRRLDTQGVAAVTQEEVATLRAKHVVSKRGVELTGHGRKRLAALERKLNDGDSYTEFAAKKPKVRAGVSDHGLHIARTQGFMVRKINDEWVVCDKYSRVVPGHDRIPADEYARALRVVRELNADVRRRVLEA